VKLVILAIYNLILLIGTAYLVGWQGWSAWWFLFTICCLSYSKPKTICECGHCPKDDE
jgi:hypothetical protein